MKLNVGYYVRTNERIFKINGRYKIVDNDLLWSSKSGNLMRKIEVKKSSKNIIDLIEVGDYVNGDYVEEIEFDNDKIKRLATYNYGYVKVYNEDIKSIVTHEQFASLEYKLGDDE